MSKTSKMSALQAALQKTNPENAVASPSFPSPKEDTPKTLRPACREGKVHLGAYLPADFKRSLRLVQAQTGEDVQTIFARALNELFRSHNVPVIES